MYGLGVTRDPKRRGKQFRARLNHRGVLDLGRFETAEEARMAYDQAVRTVRCDRKTNYPLHARIATHPGVQQKVERYIRLQEVLRAFQQASAAAGASAGSTAHASTSAVSAAAPGAAGLPRDALLQAVTGESYEEPAPAAAMTDQQAGGTQVAYLRHPAQEQGAASTAPFLQQRQHTLLGPRPNPSAGRTLGPGPAASWGAGIAAEGLAASSQMRAAPVLQLQDTSGDTDLAALLADLQAEDDMPLLPAHAPRVAEAQRQQAQQPTPSSSVAPWPAAVQKLQAPQQTKVLAGSAPGGYAPPAGGSEAGGVRVSAWPQQYAGSEQPGVLTASEGAPHARTTIPADACAGASNRHDGQQQPQHALPLTRAVHSLSSAAEVTSYADLCAAQLMQLYQRLAQHTQQHTGLVVISWIAGVRASMTLFSSSSPQSVRAAVLHTCAKLVSLGADGGVGGPCLGGPSPLSSRELLVPVVEGLTHTLLSLKVLCAEASTSQGHFSDMLESFRQQVQAGAAGSSVGQAVASLLGWL